MAISQFVHTALFRKVSISPLVTFRILFGLLMCASIIRFWTNGWIEAQYIEPTLHFKYFGFHWLPEPTDIGYYILFTIMALSAIGITFGAFYRISAVVFFLSFTYVELVDVTYYLNHYYFVSLASLLLVFLPAQRQYSIDVWLGISKPTKNVSSWCINLVMFQLGLVYLMAGIAKLNADWLINAMPLAIWLPANDHLPIIGTLFKWNDTPYIFSWAGALYDLTIPFFLLFRRTRLWAYVAVVVFHALTGILFQIGMFPIIMIGLTLIFFPASYHNSVHRALFGEMIAEPILQTTKAKSWIAVPIVVYVLFQFSFPFRHLMYDGDLFWHEQGYRFGWRVMLVEKAGYAQFKVYDQDGHFIEVDNREFLTQVQEKMMSTQPDLMIQYAHFLKQHYESQSVHTAKVCAEVYVTMNGRGSKQYIDPNVNLAAVNDGWEQKAWILPLES